MARRKNVVSTAQYRQRMAGEYFVVVSKHHRRWLRELVARYKARGRWPVLTMMLGEYYRDRCDKEVALMAAMLMSENGRVFEQVQDMRRIITDRPRKWLDERGYVNLSIGDRQNEKLAGNRKCEYWMIARLMNMLYVMLRASGSDSLEGCMGGNVYALYDRVGEELGLGEDRARLAWLVLAASDGFGQGVWGNGAAEVRCPVTGQIRRFLRMWFPNYRTYGSEDDAIRLFGLEKDSDFFYAWLAWEALKESDAPGCERYRQRYAKWYRDFCDMRKQKWDAVLPEIEF